MTDHNNRTVEVVDIDELDSAVPTPSGELSLQLVAMSKDSNGSGDIYGGWLVSQMDVAGSVKANQLARGRVATVSIDSMVFLTPVSVGSSISFFTELLKVGRSSMSICVEVWTKRAASLNQIKVTEATFTFVAIDNNGRTRPVPNDPPVSSL